MRKRLPVLAALYRKEIHSYFDTPTAYVVTVVLLLISGYLFSSPLFLVGRAVMDPFTSSAPLLFLFFVPAVTMRLYAEELRSGTIELLSTLPVRDDEVLAAKFAAAMSVVAFMLLGTSVYPVTLRVLGHPDWGAVLGSYAGLLLMSAVFASIGLWASSWTRNQITAFILSFLLGFALFLTGKVHDYVPAALQPVTDFLGLDSHMSRISRGVFDTRDLLYFASLSGYFLYLTYLNAVNRRLRG